MYNNPYPYSSDNKRYYTMNYYFQTKYHKKVAKVPLNAGFTCPNRDGTKGNHGCTFCSAKGSGDSILAFFQDLNTQYQQGLTRMRSKWPDCLGFAYFQAYSNTYADLDALKEIYNPFIKDPTVTGISIATRADCLDDEKIAYFDSLAKQKEVWIELGLQSIHEKTMQMCNRQHSTQIVEDTVNKLKQTSIKSCVHIMNSLPYETKEMMLETARWIANCKPDAIKIHMLHILQGTQMALQFFNEKFSLLSIEDYVDIVIRQLEVLPPDLIIERLTGDGMANDLIEPQWTIKKTIVLNEIDKEMVRRNTWQGKYYKK